MDLELIGLRCWREDTAPSTGFLMVIIEDVKIVLLLADVELLINSFSYTCLDKCLFTFYLVMVF